MFVALISFLDWEKARDKERLPEQCGVASTPFGFGEIGSQPKASLGSTGVTRAERSIMRLRNWKRGSWTAHDIVPRTARLIGAPASWLPS
jgi:hypothetical protein